MNERRFDPGNMWREMSDAVAGGVRQSLDFQRSVADDYQRTVAYRARPNPGRVSEGWTELRSGLTDYGSAVLKLTFDYYSDLADVATRLVEQTYPRVFEGARATTGYGPGGRTPRRAAIKVRGVIGESVEARFSIENSLDESAEVIIDAGTCRGPDGTGFSVPVELTPDALLMAPHSSDVVVARVHLADASFAPGCSYRLPISVHGPSPAIIGIEISIEEDRADKPGLTTDTERVGDDKASFTVRCPVCRRTFERTTASLVLRPHNDEWGAMCQERAGERVR